MHGTDDLLVEVLSWGGMQGLLQTPMGDKRRKKLEFICESARQIAVKEEISGTEKGEANNVYSFCVCCVW